MKTVNLVTWCNLFSSASKYSICVRKSRYRVLLYAGLTVAFLLLVLIFFTNAYHLALTIAVFVIVLVGLLLVKQNNQQVIVSRFELTRQGVCSFDDKVDYQIQRSSRLSFLGGWLILQPMPLASTMFNAKDNDSNKLIFIYRDSLSKQDFSRIAQVINQLNYQS